MTEKTSFSVDDVALSERQFLHDIANHIVIAQGMLTFIQKAAESKKPLEEKDVERIDKALSAITKMSALLKQRRVILHSQNDETI